VDINRNDVYPLLIPLPPLDEQERLVAELEANRKLVEIFEKKIQARLAEIWGKE